jgi:hypothetical protein
LQKRIQTSRKRLYLQDTLIFIELVFHPCRLRGLDDLNQVVAKTPKSYKRHGALVAVFGRCSFFFISFDPRFDTEELIMNKKSTWADRWVLVSLDQFPLLSLYALRATKKRNSTSSFHCA